MVKTLLRAPLLRRPRVGAAAARVGVLLAALSLGACSPERLAVRVLGRALAGGGDVFATDNDPELVRDALPFALTTTEALIARAPDDRRLRLVAARGFVSYAWAFPETEALLAGETDPTAATTARERAARLYLRGRDHALAALERGHPGLRDRLLTDPEAASRELAAADLDLAYWAAAGWGGALAALRTPALVADLPVVRALLERILALDERYAAGAAHDAMISLRASRQLGGSPEEARRHYERSLELAGGRRAGSHLTLAMAVAVPTQDRDLFTSLLDRALAVDADAEPRWRLENLIAQRRARYLATQVDTLFLPELDSTLDPPSDPALDPPLDESSGESPDESTDGAAAVASGDGGQETLR